MKTKKSLLTSLGLALACAVAFSLIGCGKSPSTDEKVSQQQASMLSEASKQVGMPGITNFTEMKLVRKLYEMRDSNLATFAYVPDMNGKLWHLCDSIGYGLPYGVQFSNPQYWQVAAANVRSHAMPQAEPNGLFMPPTAEGTWVICAGPKGEPDPVYVEPRVIVSPFPLNSTGEYKAK